MKNTKNNLPKNKVFTKTTIHKAHILTVEEIEQNRSKAYKYIF